MISKVEYCQKSPDRASEYMHVRMLVIATIGLFGASPLSYSQTSLTLEEQYKLPAGSPRFSKSGDKIFCSTGAFSAIYYLDNLVRDGKSSAYIVEAASGSYYEPLLGIADTLETPFRLSWGHELLDDDRIAINSFDTVGSLSRPRKSTLVLDSSEARHAGDPSARGQKINNYSYDTHSENVLIKGKDGSFVMTARSSGIYARGKSWRSSGLSGYEIAASWNEKMVAHSEHQGNVTIFEAETNNELFSFDLPGSPAVVALTFSRDNTHLLALCKIDADATAVSWGDFFPEQAERAKSFYQSGGSIVYLSLIDLKEGMVHRMPTPNEDYPIAVSRDNDIAATNKGLYYVKQKRRAGGLPSGSYQTIVFSPTDDLVILGNKVFRYKKAQISDSIFK